MAGQGRGRPPLVAERRTPKKTAKAEPAKPRARRKAKQPRKRSGNLVVRLVTGIVRWFVRLVFRLAFMGAAATALIIGLFTAYYYVQLPPVEQLLDARVRGSVTMLDRNGEVFAWRGEQFGGQITAETVSPFLRNAIVATEDRRFYSHLGISPRGIAGAIRINLAEGRGPFDGNGGSTITQQVAKLLCLGVPYDAAAWKSEADYEADCRRTTLVRKLKEVPYSFALEARYSKDEILTIYLNRVYLGAGSRGFEAASQRYFGISAANVSPSEAAMLAGLLKAPSYYAPTANLDRSRARAATILRLMADQGYLSEGEYAFAVEHPAELSQAAAARAGGYFADWVMESVPSFLAKETTEDVVIRTTFDPRIQAAAEEAMQSVFTEKVKEGSKAEAAIVVMSADGAVRAMVGGRDVKAQGAFNRATQALRQTGSSFKPFVYAAAMDLGYSPNDTIVDEAITIDIPGSRPWSPSNYDNKFHGRVTLAEALAQSLNIPAVKISEFVGRDTVRKIASDFGLESDLALGPALALGASEATLIDMTGAYAGILNGGSSVRPYGLTELRLQGEDEPLMGQEGGMGERVISEHAARELVWMMNGVMTSGTGRRAALPDREAAGKTGTTSDYRDAWFMGFTADYVAGVWMGYDDNSPMTGVTGSGLPAEIWKETMIRVHEGLPARPLPMDAPTAAPQMSEGAGAVYAGETYGGTPTAPRQSAPQQQGGDPVGNAINDVLNAIFGNPGR